MLIPSKLYTFLSSKTKVLGVPVHSVRVNGRSMVFKVGNRVFILRRKRTPPY